MRQVHIIMPFSRHHLLPTIVELYRTKNVVVHTLTYQDEPPVIRDEPWIQSHVVPIPLQKGKGTPLINWFINNVPIIEDDYYVTASDDDKYESETLEAVLSKEALVVVISMKRGHHVTLPLHTHRAYPCFTLFASPENMKVGHVGGEQIFMRGAVLKLGNIRFDEDQDPIADGIVAEYLAENYSVHYEKDQYALFNYFEPGRWNKDRMAFGVLVNDLTRLDMVLKQSEIDPAIKCYSVMNPDNATTGLNTLLIMMEAEGADVGVLTHQDMFYRNGWTDQIKELVSRLPESWVLAGPIGKDMDGCIKGLFHDMRIPLLFDYGPLPVEASCLDECCIIVNLKKGFRFDETLKGFDLYGSLGILQVREMGGTSWIVDAFCEHYCMRPFSWYPDKAFEDSYRWLHSRFPNQYIDSTVIGVPKEVIEKEKSRLKRAIDNSRIPTGVSNTEENTSYTICAK